MTVYVDDMYAPFGRMKMCHMIADSHEELVSMAVRIGVQPKWIQQEGTPEEHFDVSKAKRALAVTAGAVEITLRELAFMTRYRWRADDPEANNDRVRSLTGLGNSLVEETGMPGVGVNIWRRGEGRWPLWRGTVGAFLSRPEYQNGTWLIDGGWGGPPGPIEVDWVDGRWVNQGYCGRRRAS